MAKNISILGSTGSIGVQTLEVLRDTGCAAVLGLTANNNIDLLEKQIYEFKPQKAAVMNEEKAFELKKRLTGSKTEILCGMDGVLETAQMGGVDTVVNALVGNVGLTPTMAAIAAGKNIALANKETLVTSGELVMSAVKENGVSLYPIDSEHSAIFQCLHGNGENPIEKIYLTASGGPFIAKNAEELQKVTLADALKHPNWTMGRKITIDSATMMNKGLEVIEAMWLFGVSLPQIHVLVHPQSIIHSMVEFADGAIMAQLGEPDMRVPIQYALAYPKRLKNNYPRLDFLTKSTLTFQPPDRELFPCLDLAFRAAEAGGNLPAVMNGANEAAVELFMSEKIRFVDIPLLIEKTMSAYNEKGGFSIETVLNADKWAREFVAGVCRGDY